MATYVYVLATGALYSWNPDNTSPVASAAALAAAGLGAATNLPALGPTVAWSPSTLTTITVTAPTPANVINTFDFLMAFTATELATIRASTNASIQQFLFALQVTQGVNLNSTTISNALAFLVTQGLLTQARSNAIAATVNSQSASGS